MGTIAARDCLRILDLGEQVLAALLLAGAQGVALRSALPGARSPSPAVVRTARAIESAHGRQGADRELDLIVEACVGRIRSRLIPVAG